MRIVFLDMDGVLNSVDFFDGARQESPTHDEHEAPDPKSLIWWTRMVDPLAVKRLNQILADTEAKVVISSSWRYHVTADRMQEVLEDKGFVGEVISRTPRQSDSGYRSETRGHEIERWLVDNKHLGVEGFVILDDMGPGAFAHMSPWLVQSSWARGLLDEHVPRAVTMLQTAPHDVDLSALKHDS
jgi:hypothetical protein